MSATQSKPEFDLVLRTKWPVGVSGSVFARFCANMANKNKCPSILHFAKSLLVESMMLADDL